MSITQRGEVILNNTGNRNLMIESNDSDSWLTFHDPDNYWYSMGIDRSDGGKFKLNAGGQIAYNHFTMDANGNVGLGTSAPGGKLEINYAGGQLKLAGGTVAGGLYTNAVDMLYVGDWNTGNKAIQINMTTGDINLGGNVGSTTGYGSLIQLLGTSSNSDAIWMARYNNGDNKSEFRINIGDDYGQSEDMFVVGTNYWANGQWYPHLAVQASGNVRIGTSSPDAKLAVKGNIHTQEVKVDLTGAVAPDYVFEKDYDLLSLLEIESYINQHKHLPEVPSAKQMEEEGLNLKEMNLILLKKVEELTLHLIEIKKENSIQQKEIELLKSKNK